MEVSEFTLKLIIVLIPGAIASIIFEKLTTHKKWDSFKFIANSILFGGFSYLVAQLIFRNDQSLQKFWSNLSQKDIPFSAVWKAIILSVVVGLLCSMVDHYKLLNKFGRKFRLTNKYGDINLYSHFLNASNIQEVYFRDFPNELTYYGLIESFSETEEFRELSLRSVKVYDLESEFLYEIDKIYLCRPKDQLTIEVPYIEVPYIAYDQNNKQNQQNDAK